MTIRRTLSQINAEKAPQDALAALQRTIGGNMADSLQLLDAHLSAAYQIAEGIRQSRVEALLGSSALKDDEDWCHATDVVAALDAIPGMVSTAERQELTQAMETIIEAAGQSRNEGPAMRRAGLQHSLERIGI